MPLTRNGAAKVHIFLKKCKQNPEKVMLCIKILAGRLLLYVNNDTYLQKSGQAVSHDAACPD